MPKFTFLTLAGCTALLVAGCSEPVAEKKASPPSMPMSLPADLDSKDGAAPKTDTTTDLGTPATPESGSVRNPGAELAPAAGADQK